MEMGQRNELELSDRHVGSQELRDDSVAGVDEH